jgi:hypothetical protein
VYRSSVRTPEGKTLLADLGTDKSIILKWMKEVGCMDVAFIHLLQDRIQSQALVNTTMNLRVP